MGLAGTQLQIFPFDKLGGVGAISGNMHTHIHLLALAHMDTCLQTHTTGFTLLPCSFIKGCFAIRKIQSLNLFFCLNFLHANISDNKFNLILLVYILMTSWVLTSFLFLGQILWSSSLLRCLIFLFYASFYQLFLHV